MAAGVLELGGDSGNKESTHDRGKAGSKTTILESWIEEEWV